MVKSSPVSALTRSLRVLADRLDSGEAVVLDWHERAGVAKVPRGDRGKWATKKLTGQHTLTVRFRERGE